MLPNGDVLLSLSPRVTEGITPNFPSPTFIYDFNPTTQVFTDVTPSNSVDSQLAGNNSFITTMLVLPTGQVMLTTSRAIQICIPRTVLLIPRGGRRSQPGQKWNGNYTLTGTQLNGLDEGAAYGDDNGMSKNYPDRQSLMW